MSIPVQETAETEAKINSQHGLPVIVKVLIFMFSLILIFTGFGHLLPQVEGHAPRDIKVDFDNLTMERYISIGEELYSGKGTCTLCHNNLGRAPDLLVMDMEKSSAERLKNPLYQGEAKNAQEYYLESMVAPNIYVLPGYSKPGEASSMPAINKAPIELSDFEMNAIIAFLQAKNGGPVTVELPSNIQSKKDNVFATKTAAIVVAPAANVKEVIIKYSCTTCHALLDSASTIGPELKSIGLRASKGEIRQSIINPSAITSPGFPLIMPLDYATRMTINELEMLVDFLAAATAGEGHKEKENKHPETAIKGE